MTPRRSTERGGGRGRSAHAMPGAGPRHEQHFEPRAARAKRPVDVLDVGEQLLVEQADLLDRGSGDGHQRSVGAVGGPDAVVPGPVAPALAAMAARVPEPGEEALASV